MKSITIACIGGHLSPALAVIEEIQKQKKDWKILFFGRMHAQETDVDVSHEYQVITEMGIPFFPIPSARFNRFISVQSFLFFLRFPFGLCAATYYLLRERPSVVVSFGGYVALPVSVAAWLLGIPVLTHEQTSVMGLTNQIVAQFASKILVTFDTTKGIPKDTEVTVVGLPLREALFHPPQQPSFTLPKGLPILFVTGGTTGSQSINDAIFPIVENIVHNAVVIHQTGKYSYNRAVEVRNLLSESLRKRYIIQQNFSTVDMSFILHRSTLIIGRSGANTVMEILTFNKQAIFIPLPWSGNGEQYENALRAQKIGAREILSQDELTPSELQKRIDMYVKKKISVVSHVVDASQARVAIVREIENLLSVRMRE